MTKYDPRPRLARPHLAFLKFIPTVLILLVLAGLWWAVHQINTGPSAEEPSAALESMGPTDTAPSDVLRLGQDKLDALGLQSVAVQRRFMQHEHTVPGRLQYDETRHIQLKAPLDGILEKIEVVPGQHVQQGQLLAILRSPEIGRARAEVLKCEKDREIAGQVLDREQTLAGNLQKLFQVLDQGRPMKEVEKDFSDRPLGSYRQEILSAYTKWKLASELLSNLQPLAQSGSVPARSLKEREVERQLAETAFRTARDQANYSASQAKLKAEAELAQADRQLRLAKQTVEALLGYQEAEFTCNLDTDASLSCLELRAPFDCTVESRVLANNERVEQGSPILVLANTQSLYVSASLRDDDWKALALQPGTKISVVVPALENRESVAQLQYVGREVQANTSAVPLIATVDNQDQLLRPGMFVRVTLPIGPAREAIAVPVESILQHEQKSFVFLEGAPGTYQRVDVVTGQTSRDWIEITAGLRPGQRVVTRGAFLLKSELLLQGEGA